MTSSNRFVIAVIVPDRVGILRDVAKAIFDLHGDIDGITQTVLSETFSVTLTATFNAPVVPADLQTGISRRLLSGAPSVIVRPHTEAIQAASQTGERYIATVSGKQHPGILRSLTDFLVALGINIEDWQMDISPPHILHIGELTVPRRLDIKQLQDDFRDLLESLDLAGNIFHENIFRATNEIGPIQALLSEPRHDS